MEGEIYVYRKKEKVGEGDGGRTYHKPGLSKPEGEVRENSSEFAGVEGEGDDEGSTEDVVVENKTPVVEAGDLAETADGDDIHGGGDVVGHDEHVAEVVGIEVLDPSEQGPEDHEEDAHLYTAGVGGAKERGLDDHHEESAQPPQGGVHRDAHRAQSEHAQDEIHEVGQGKWEGLFEGLCGYQNLFSGIVLLFRNAAFVVILEGHLDFVVEGYQG